MKLANLALCMAVTVLGEALAQSPPVPPATPLPKVAADTIFIPAASARTFPMAEWDVVQRAAGEQTGVRVLIAEGEEAVAKAPANASRYEARSYKFPTGALRVLTWRKDSGPVVHQITFETELYVLQGSADVEVRGEVVRVDAGDAVFLPSGVLRNMSPKEDTVILQYFVGNTAKEPKSKVVRGKDLAEGTVIQWMQDGKPVTVRSEAEASNAPANAGRYKVKRYPFDGNSIRYAALQAGGTTTPATYQVDILIYIAKGRMRRTEGDQVFEVKAGDAIREVKGQTGYWEILEDSVFIASDAPFNPAAPRANP